MTKSEASDFVPLLVENTKFAAAYESLCKSQGSAKTITCDLVLIQITCNVPTHDKADVNLMDDFPVNFRNEDGSANPPGNDRDARSCQTVLEKSLVCMYPKVVPNPK